MNDLEFLLLDIAMCQFYIHPTGTVTSSGVSGLSVGLCLVE